MFCIDGGPCRLTACTAKSRVCERDVAVIAARPVIEKHLQLEFLRKSVFEKDAEIADLRTKLIQQEKDAKDAARYRRWKEIAQPSYVLRVYPTDSRSTVQDVQVGAGTWDAMDAHLDSISKIQHVGG